jgi:hypothetical protein
MEAGGAAFFIPAPALEWAGFCLERSPTGWGRSPIDGRGARRASPEAQKTQAKDMQFLVFFVLLLPLFKNHCFMILTLFISVRFLTAKRCK